MRADSTSNQFKCVKCGERTTMDLGSALAQGTATRQAGRSDHPKQSAALIGCPACGKKVSRKAPACPGCGEPILRESKVVVYGYTQQFLMSPKVQVFWNGEPVGSVKRGERISFDVDSPGEVSFRASGRKASLQVQAGNVTTIKIAWDRISGKMIPQIVEAITPGA